MTRPGGAAAAVGRLVVVSAAAVWLCRLGPSDRLLVTGVLAYVPPAATLLAATVGFALAAPGLSPWRAFALLLAAASLAQIVADNPRLLARAPAADGVRLLHWNVARNPGTAGPLRRLAADADIVALNESTGLPMGLLGPGFEEWDDSGIRLLARAPIERHRTVELPGGRALHALVRTSPPISILVVDLSAQPWISRWRALEALAAETGRFDPVPDVVVGDLNTPPHAASLGLLLAAGYLPPPPPVSGGPRYTWPTPLPVIRLDHVLVRPPLAVASHASGASRRSDHRWQRVVLRP